MQKAVPGRLLPVPPHRLSDEGWLAIARISGLPTQARLDVECAISISKISNIELSIDETRRDFATAEKSLTSAQSALARLVVNPRAIAALSSSQKGLRHGENYTPERVRANLLKTTQDIERTINLISAGRKLASAHTKRYIGLEVPELANVCKRFLESAHFKPQVDTPEMLRATLLAECSHIKKVIVDGPEKAEELLRTALEFSQRRALEKANSAENPA
jgi:hypothetical protein